MLMSRYLLFRSTLLAATCAVLGAAGCGSQADLGASNVSVEQDPTAEALIAKMRAVYANAKSYAGNAEVIEQAVRRGEGVERDTPYFTMAVAFQRPNRLSFSFQEAIRSADGEGRCDVTSDGTVVRATANERPGQVFEGTAPLKLTIDNFLADRQLRDAVLEVAPFNLFPHLVMLFDNDRSKPLFPEDENPHRLGPKDLRGRTCYRVALDHANGKRVLWIDAETYVLHRVELPSAGQREDMDPEGQYVSFAIRVDFHSSEFDVSISPSTFVMEVTDDARRVRKFVEPPPPGPHEWLGEEVADFKFTTLDGEEFSRSELIGKPTLLDFWFTECAPCRKQTPVLEKVYEELKDAEMQFYAVSSDPPRVSNIAVESTLENWGGSMPILRVEEEAEYEKLHVEKFPTIVLLDADARLQLFHLGPYRTAEPLLRAARKVLAGDDLAEEARAAHQKVVDKFEADLEKATIKDSLLEVEVLDDPDELAE